MDINKFIESHAKKSHVEVSELLRKEGVIMTSDAVRKRRQRAKIEFSPKELVAKDIQEVGERRRMGFNQQKYKVLLEEVEELQDLLQASKLTKEVHSHTITAQESKDSEATAVVLASDWHSEECVESEVVNDLNEFNLEVADSRMGLFFVNVTKLIKQKQKSIRIKNLVLALLGDFISGSIHDELAETNLLPPAEAVINVQNKIASGIEYILKNTDVSLIIPCHSGNHARMTIKQRHANERGNSLEFIMYHNLANYFRTEKRVKFLIASGYHSYVDICGYVIRFHHGHSLKYGGGIGGLFIPTFKAISQWQKARHADLDCFGHWHQFRDGGNFICNGSLIGYSAYALSIKAEFEKPKQAFFLVHHTRKEKTELSPIWLD